jgi:hypothetical protein
MQNLTRILGALAVTAAVMAVPDGVSAQVDESAPACSAEVAPTEVAAGANAVRVTVTLSEDIGAVASIETSEDSGLALAAATDLPRVPLATEQPSVITPAMGEHAWTVWVNTSESEPGTHEVTFIGPEGRCTADLTVTAPN